jgi:thymidylate synthase
MVKHIMREGREIVDQRESTTKEVLNMVWTVEKPEASVIPEGFPLGREAVNAYKDQLLNPDRQGFVYTYGNRLRNYMAFSPSDAEENEKRFQKTLEKKKKEFEEHRTGKAARLTKKQLKKRLNKIKLDKKELIDIKLEGTYAFIDQIKRIILELKEAPTSRRAIGVTWRIPEDLLTDEVPCMILVDFKIRDEQLFTTVVFRSNDIFGAAPANFVAIRELSRFVANELSIPIGPITVQSISAHIYEGNWDEAMRIK